MNRPGLKIVSPGTRTMPRACSKLRFATTIPSSTSSTSSSIAASRKTCHRTTTSCRSEKANVRRKGKDLSIITWGAMLYVADQAGDELAKDGVSVEIIDLRSILPFDEQAILESVAKTNRVIILHEAPLTAERGRSSPRASPKKHRISRCADQARSGSRCSDTVLAPLEEFYLRTKTK